MQNVKKSFMSIGVDNDVYFCLLNLKKARGAKNINEIVRQEFEKAGLLTKENCTSPYEAESVAH